MEVEFCYKHEYYDTIEGETIEECKCKFNTKHPFAQEIIISVL